MPPQGNIARYLGRPSESDVVVVIFWQRFGTPLDPTYGFNPIGECMTGTEYEFYDAINATRPLVYVYRCTKEEDPPGVSSDQLKEIERQRDKVQAFFEREFQYPNGAYRRDYHTYGSTEEFSQLFEKHFRLILEELVSRSQNNTKEIKPVPEPDPGPVDEPAKPDGSSKSLAAGKKVSGYELVKELSKGGNDVVWLARDNRLSRHVAIKFLHHRKRRESFASEMQKLAKLNHPHILPVYASGSFNGMPYMVIPYFEESTDLSQRMSSAQTTPEQAIEWLQQIASALDYCHQENVVHRNVKPHNVLVKSAKRSGQVEEILLLANFGPVWEENVSPRLSSGNERAGTSSYMAPEQTLNAEPHPSMDLYALGIIAYEMLTGELPFLCYVDSHLDDELIRQAHRENPLPQRQLSDAVFEVLKRATAKKPNERFESAEAFVTALRVALFSKSETRHVVASDVSTQTRTQVLQRTDSPNPYERALAYDLLADAQDDRRLGLGLDDLLWADVVSEGQYIIGGDPQAVHSLSLQQRCIKLTYSFAMSAYLVTNRQFDAFVEADRKAFQENEQRPWWNGINPTEANIELSYNTKYNSPRDRVSWWQGLAFCRWLTGWMHEAGLLETDWMIDLPTDIEWEAATRFEGKLYPWGHLTMADIYYSGYANVDETDGGKQEGFCLGRSCAVGIYDDDCTDSGLYDTCGNLLQWCYAWGATNGNQSLRGASWFSKPRSLASRLLKNPSSKYNIIGLRLVKRPKNAVINRITFCD
ncbi:MAG: bifunctional serine/threonine-protein kinase/formylglycine-generating enzyme family protein [Anaerolineae bacterium]|nr:bifunctional serine/threonine-protein kinase/formylglycine-generating enzyme family protein [Anaerolineae bacterium]MDW8173881.1 bifunctional serine/threonine-protein kinase/formylglycine-generating enzyme family protein [Anaerolineae bacterium]